MSIAKLCLVTDQRPFRYPRMVPLVMPSAHLRSEAERRLKVTIPVERLSRRWSQRTIWDTHLKTGIDPATRSDVPRWSESSRGHDLIISCFIYVRYSYIVSLCWYRTIENTLRTTESCLVRCLALPARCLMQPANCNHYDCGVAAGPCVSSPGRAAATTTTTTTTSNNDNNHNHKTHKITCVASGGALCFFSR